MRHIDEFAVEKTNKGTVKISLILYCIGIELGDAMKYCTFSWNIIYQAPDECQLPVFLMNLLTVHHAN